MLSIGNMQEYSKKNDNVIDRIPDHVEYLLHIAKFWGIPHVSNRKV